MPDNSDSNQTQTNTPEPPKPSLIRHFSTFSRVQLLVVALIFAGVGGYVIWRSFAAGTPVASLEAEQMSLPAGGNVIKDKRASGGRAITLSTNGTASGTVNFGTDVTSVSVTAKGAQCQGAPQMVVSIDGTNVIDTPVGSTNWSAFTGTANYKAGTHTLAVSFNNDYSKSNGKKTTCSRDLSLDVTVFYGDVTPPPPAPTVSLSASPSTVSAGQASTLTWNSTNAGSCDASGAWSGAQATAGSTSTGALNQTSTYTLTCTGSGGSTAASTTVTVSLPQKPTPPTVYFNPSSQTYSVGSTFTIDVREDSATQTVNAVQANFSYPADKLSFVSADGSASGFTTQAQNTGGAGQVTLARGIIGSLSGDQLVAKVTFKVDAAGVANLSFINGTSLVSSTTNQSILSSLSATGIGAYTLQ